MYRLLRLGSTAAELGLLDEDGMMPAPLADWLLEIDEIYRKVERLFAAELAGAER